MIRGCDYADYQELIDGETLSRAGYAFAIGKATEGTYYKNTRFYATNRASVEASGMLPGSYHYCAYGDPIREADAFLGFIGNLPAGHLLALDVEDCYDAQRRIITPPGSLLDAVYPLADHIYQQTGVRVLIYSNQSFLADHNLHALAVHNFGLWLASWQDADPAPVPDWPVVAFWQKAPGVIRDGVSGSGANLDYFNGAVARLALYGAR